MFPLFFSRSSVKCFFSQYLSMPVSLFLLKLTNTVGTVSLAVISVKTTFYICKNVITNERYTICMYSRTCLGRPPLLPSKNGLSRQVVAHSRS